MKHLPIALSFLFLLAAALCAEEPADIRVEREVPDRKDDRPERPREHTQNRAESRACGPHGSISFEESYRAGPDARRALAGDVEPTAESICLASAAWNCIAARKSPTP